MHIPKEIERALQMGATLAVGISGGKDSQAMLKVVSEYHKANNYTGRIFAVHADLGRVEWPQSMEMCQHTCNELGIELIVVRREKGDMLDRWQERMDKLKGTGKPFWSSAKERYCTSDMKRGPINKELRKTKDIIISVEGIRRQESRNRAKKPYLEIRKPITSTKYKTEENNKNKRKFMTVSKALDKFTSGNRLGITWNPILDYTVEEVYNTYGHTKSDLIRRQLLYRGGNKTESLQGWKFHPAYVFGNKRVSCMICVLACDNDIKNGAKHNPELARTMMDMEVEGDATLKNGKSLAQIVEKGERKTDQYKGNQMNLFNH